MLPGMPDQEISPPPSVLVFIQDTRKVLDSLPDIEAPPLLVTQTARALQPFIASMLAATYESAAPNREARYLDTLYARWQAPATPTHQSRVPTAGELVETDQALRTKVLPKTSEAELQEAVSGLQADPEKLRLAAFLAEVIRKATGLPAPWVVFVFVFCVAVNMNPDVVSALALAYAVMQDTRGDG